MSQNPSSNPHEVFLLICTDRIGDNIITLPSVTALRKKNHTALIIFLALLYTVPLIEQYKDIDLFLTSEPEARHQGWPGIMRKKIE